MSTTSAPMPPAQSAAHIPPAYRPDIDGLRAVAVLAVVVFHLLPGWLPGGFVGVDIFFVISGFLITGIITSDIRAGRFSWMDFYERRARRLLPAMFAVTAVVLALTYWLFLPADLERACSTGFSAITSWSNIWLEETQDYFAPSGTLNPFLHTWSLSVEEQFYILAVPALLLLSRHDPGGRRLGWGLLILTVVSLGWSGWNSWKKPDAAYFLIFNRAWELLFGALLAIRRPPLLARWQQEGLVWLGLLLIATSLALVHEGTLFPVWGALPACTGTAMIIACGQGTGSGQRLLSLPPCVWIGRMSYSLYLWHWPVIVVAGYLAMDELTQWQRLTCIPLMIALAWASQRWVEQPFRRPVPGRRKAFLLGCAGVACVLSGLSLAGWLGGGWPQRLDPDVRRLVQVEKDAFKSGRLDPAEIIAGNAIVLGRPGGEPTFVLWGDSHAKAVCGMVHQLASDGGITGSYLGAAASMPVVGLRRKDNRIPQYEERNQAVLTYIERHPTIRRVILWGRWDLCGHYEARSGFFAEEDTALADWDLLSIALQRTIADLHRMGRQVILVRQVPRLRWEPSTLARRLHTGGATPPLPDLADHATYQQPFQRILGMLDKQPGWTLLDPGPALFDDQGRLRLIDSGKLLYKDDNHLSYAGALYLRPFVEQEFRRLGVLPDPPPVRSNAGGPSAPDP